MRTTLGGNVYNEGSFFDLRGGLNNRLSTELIQRDELSRVFNYVPNLTSEAILVKRKGLAKVSSDRALPITSIFDGTTTRWATDTGNIFNIASNVSYSTIPFDGGSVGLTGFPSWTRFKAQTLDLIATGTQLLKWDGAKFDYLRESSPVELFSYNDGEAWPGTFTRASTAFKKNSSLQLVSAAIDELRSVHYLTATDVGTLLEPASSNLLTYSEDLTHANWVKATGVTISANSANEPVVSPSGLMDGIVEDPGIVYRVHTVHRASISVAANSRIAGSVYVRRGLRDWLRFVIHDQATISNNIVVYANLATGELFTSSLGVFSEAVSYIEEMADDVFRVYLAGLTGGGITSLRYVIGPVISNTETTYLGNNSAPGIYAWGMQLEQLAWPTSYIPRLDATAASRSQDIMYQDFSPARDFEAMTVLMDRVEIGGRYGHALYIINLGTGGSAANPRIYLWHDTSTVIYNYRWFNSAGTQSQSFPAGLPDVGSQVVNRLILHPEGAAQQGRSVNGATETLAAKGAAVGIDGTYNRLQIGATTTGASAGLVLLKSIKVETLPPKVTLNPKYITTYNNMVVAAGHDKGKVRFSAINNASSWPVENERDIGDTVVGLGVYNDLLLVFTDRKLYHMRGFSPLTIQVPYSISTDCTSHRSIITSEHGLFWWGTQGMMWSPDAFNAFILTDLKVPLTVAGLNSLLYDRVHGIYNLLDQRIEYYLTSVGETVEKLALYYYPRVGVKAVEGLNVGGFWPQTGLGVEMQASAVVTVSGRKLIYLGSHTTGYIYQQTGSLDDGTAISAVLETKTDTTEFGPIAVKRLRQLVPRLFMSADGLVQYSIILDDRVNSFKVWTLAVVGAEGFLLGTSVLNVGAITVSGASKDFKIGASERFRKIRHIITDSVEGYSGVVGIINTGYLVNI